MSIPLILAVTVAYLGVSIDQGFKGNWPVCVMFAGYAIANLGIIGVTK